MFECSVAGQDPRRSQDCRLTGKKLALRFIAHVLIVGHCPPPHSLRIPLDIIHVISVPSLSQILPLSCFCVCSHTIWQSTHKASLASQTHFRIQNGRVWWIAYTSCVLLHCRAVRTLQLYFSGSMLTMQQVIHYLKSGKSLIEECVSCSRSSFWTKSGMFFASRMFKTPALETKNARKASS